MLIDKKGFPRVSLFLPTHRVTADADQDRIRLKNLLKDAEERLLASGMRAPDAREMLEPVWQLDRNAAFWAHQSDGLAIFVAPDLIRHYRVPLALPELVVVSDRFQIKPLVPLLTSDERFYLLAISQDHVRLLEGTRTDVVDVDLGTMPESLAEALKFDDPQKQLQYHSRAAPRGTKRAAMFFGHGQAHGEDDKDRLLRYFQAIDHGLQQLLREQRVPLILAGVDYYFPIYREVNSYPHLIAEGVSGSPEGLSDAELRDRAWNLVEPWFREKRDAALAHYRELAGTPRVSSDLKEIVPATAQGRVEALFVVPGLQRWGRFDPQTQEVVAHDAPESGDHDLLDLAVVKAFQSKAEIYTTPPSEMPNGSPISAVFRY
jgi:hypothetical protein